MSAACVWAKSGDIVTEIKEKHSVGCFLLRIGEGGPVMHQGVWLDPDKTHLAD